MGPQTRQEHGVDVGDALGAVHDVVSGEARDRPADGNQFVPPDAVVAEGPERRM
jgi:hypothetical protein